MNSEPAWATKEVKDTPSSKSPPSQSYRVGKFLSACVWFLANDQETIAGPVLISVLVSVVLAPLHLAETSLSADVPDLGEMMGSRELGRQGVCNISLCDSEPCRLSYTK